MGAISRNLLRGGAAGVLAQSFTLAALLLPIILGLGSALVIVVQVSAIATVAIPISTLAVTSILPIASSRTEALRSIALSSSMLIVSTILVGTVVALVGRATNSPDFISTAAVTAFLLLAQGSYYVSTALLTFRLDYQQIMIARLIYGILVLAFTAVACVLFKSGESIIVAAGSAYLVATFWVMARQTSWFTGSELVGTAPSRRWRHQLRRSVPLALSFTIGALSGNAAVVVLPVLGDLKPDWAIVIRLAGGFATVAIQILAPAVDVAIVSGLRERAGKMVRSAFRNSILAGSAIGVVSIVASAIGIFWAGSGRLEGAPLLFGLLGYAGFTVAILTCGRTLSMVSSPAVSLCWEVARFTTVALCVLYFRSQTALIAIGTALTVFAILYWLLVHFGVSRSPKLRS